MANDIQTAHVTETGASPYAVAITMSGHRLTGAALTADQRAKLIEVAAKCPVQRTLEGTPLIRTIAS